MFSSLLTSLVGGFEMFIADLANYAYREFPAALSLSGASFTWQDVTSHSSIESLREQTIERAVNEMLRASFDDWLATFEKKFSVAVPSVVREVAVREVFQRRNLVVHNDSVVNELYREKVRGLPECPPVGVQLVVDAEYLRDAADRLWATAWHLAWAFGDKLIKGGDREIFEMFICNVPYRHLEDKRYRAIEFADCAHVVRSVKDEGNALILKVNVWLAKKRLGKFDECRDEIVAWPTAHLSPQYQLARLALLDQLEEGMALVEEIRYTKNLSFTSWYTWPLLEELREYELRLASGQKELEPPPQ
ncbi:hypothetical protein OERS_22460 [Oerskovia enterophila]|uniref:Uncharacterized protein n=2 Tax=Oerskovia enterophila TaxID=43678 RepID=A0ABX2Y3M8_9CELL|nr:hypothetical protein OERS_22460 [Oerskovia enterophila]